MAQDPQDEISNNASASNISNSTPKHEQKHGSDPDAQEMVIASLRSQIQDLFSQVTQLNAKLVQSYDRVSDLEDELHVASSNVRSSSIQISQLELERTQHLSALNTGLLVEKSHVTAELTRLMEKATEEAAQRGQAESARQDIEKDLDDLSATLFGQANTMVAEARYAQALSERKVEEAEQALKGAEEAVGIMQQQMQTLQAEKEETEKSMQGMQMVMGKGKWVDRQDNILTAQPLRLLSSHAPYREFLLFVAHLRSIHPTMPNPPAMTTLLTLPFLARLLNEDSEPTIRLDLAPSLNWLSRRSVLSAIHNGQLTIEPMSSSVLLQESTTYSTPTNIPGLNNSNNSISCALCGTHIFSQTTPEQNNSRPPSYAFGTNSYSPTGSWSTTLFKKPLSYSTNNSPSGITSPPATPPRGRQTHTLPSQPRPPQIHIFRLSSPTAPAISSVSVPTVTVSTSSFASSSLPSQQSYNNATQQPANINAQSTTVYPLCTNGWCLTRLRMTCTLWAFVRTGVVEKIWEEEIPTLLASSITSNSSSNGEKPPVPPRRKGLWGMASAFGERAASWSDSDKEKSKKTQAQPVEEPKTPPVREPRRLPPKPTPLPPPPPTHPTIAATHTNAINPPPAPPPLPKRNLGRGQTTNMPDTPRTSNEIFDTDVVSDAIVSETAEAVAPAEPAALPRPSTPASIPLPESRPSTPLLPVRSASRTTSPTAKAAPPPLPRRAAARVPHRSSADFSSQPGTPTLPTGVRSADSIGNGETKNASAFDTTNVVEKDNVKPDNGPPSLQHVDGDVIAEEVVSGPASHVEDVFTEPMAESRSHKIEAGDDPLLSSSPVSDDVFIDAETENADTDVGHSKSEESEVPAIHEIKNSDNEAKGNVNGNSPKDNGEVYIGDTTWEERTWKEIIRLREEMFWARVGGLK